MAGIKNSEYLDEADWLEENDLLDLCKRVGTGPDVFDSQKLPGKTTFKYRKITGSGTIQQQVLFEVATTTNGSVNTLWTWVPAVDGVYTIKAEVVARWAGGLAGVITDLAVWEMKYAARVASGSTTTTTPIIEVIENAVGYEIDASGNIITGIGATDNIITWTLKITIVKAA